MKTAPGNYHLSLPISKDIFEKSIKVIPGLFETQTLSLPKKMVGLDHKTLKRVEAELSRLANLWPIMNKKLWEEKFIMPLQGETISPFWCKEDNK